MTVFLPLMGRASFERSLVDYDVRVQPNCCDQAESPTASTRGQTMTDARGRSVVNPLYIVYGCFQRPVRPDPTHPRQEVVLR